MALPGGVRGTRLARIGITVMMVVGLLTLGAPALTMANSTCRSVQVPVSLPDVAPSTLYGELCIPSGDQPSTVQLLVHGGTYNHYYWDLPYRPNKYSYVRKALDQGYATFNVDRLGVGQSSRPPSTKVTLQNDAETLHQVISGLRDGSIGPRFDRVVWVGHSLGSIVAWIEASMYSDVDAFVLTANSHNRDTTGPQATLWQARLDPKFDSLNLDEGYYTTRPDTRGNTWYYLPNADPNVIDVDEQVLKDTISATEGFASVPLISSPPPETAPSRNITVPVLLTYGQFDGTCKPPNGSECTPENMFAAERPYYSPEVELSVIVIDDAGHDIQLHRNSEESTGQILHWIDKTLD
jgi:pimeloyl-ACP methyl ester carboxylesterase